jgi:hypothetical protein
MIVGGSGCSICCGLLQGVPLGSEDCLLLPRRKHQSGPEAATKHSGSRVGGELPPACEWRDVTEKNGTQETRL